MEESGKEEGSPDGSPDASVQHVGMTMTLQEGVTRLSTANSTSEIWKEAMDHQVIDNQGSWPVLGWGSTSKQLKIMDKVLRLQRNLL